MCISQHIRSPYIRSEVEAREHCGTGAPEIFRADAVASTNPNPGGRQDLNLLARDTEESWMGGCRPRGRRFKARYVQPATICGRTDDRRQLRHSMRLTEPVGAFGRLLVQEGRQAAPERGTVSLARQDHTRTPATCSLGRFKSQESLSRLPLAGRSSIGGQRKPRARPWHRGGGVPRPLRLPCRRHNRLAEVRHPWSCRTAPTAIVGHPRRHQETGSDNGMGDLAGHSHQPVQRRPCRNFHNNLPLQIRMTYPP